jgi:hypothetical protein
VERYWRRMLCSRSWAGRRLTWDAFNQIKERTPLLPPNPSASSPLGPIPSPSASSSSRYQNSPGRQDRQTVTVKASQHWSSSMAG